MSGGNNFGHLFRAKVTFGPTGPPPLKFFPQISTIFTYVFGGTLSLTQSVVIVLCICHWLQHLSCTNPYRRRRLFGILVKRKSVYFSVPCNLLFLWLSSCLWRRDTARSRNSVESQLPGVLQTEQGMCLEDHRAWRIHCRTQVSVLWSTLCSGDLHCWGNEILTVYRVVEAK